jgi:hypothetical protein
MSDVVHLLTGIEQCELAAAVPGEPPMPANPQRVPDLFGSAIELSHLAQRS